jgi:hypothetical protein
MIWLPVFALRSHFVNEQLVFGMSHRRAVDVAIVADPHHVAETPFQQIFSRVAAPVGVGIFYGAFCDAQEAIAQIVPQFQRFLLAVCC